MRFKSPLLFLLAVWFLVRTSSAEVLTGQAFPALNRFGLEGTIPPYRGKVTIVDLWASWCPPCRQSFAAFENLLKRFGKDKVVVIAVSLDESSDDLHRFLALHPPSFATPHDSRHSLANAVAPPGMPTTYILDPAGTVQLVHTGFHPGVTEKEFEKVIARLLGSPSRP